MIHNSNIDKNDAAVNTNAPFRWDCPLNIDSIILPKNTFLSVIVYITESMIPPVRISSFTRSSIVFVDSAGTHVGSCPISDYDQTANIITAFIYNDEGSIAGHISVTKDLIDILLSLSDQTVVSTSVNDFILLPQQHISMFTGSCKVIALNDVYHTADVTQKSGNYIITNTTDTAKHTFSVNLYGSYKEIVTSDNCICKLKVNGQYYWIGDRHLFITHSKASNLRVVQRSASVVMKGVKDE